MKGAGHLEPDHPEWGGLRVLVRKLGKYRASLYGAALAALVVAVVLLQFAPPCADMLDGPCGRNWATAPSFFVTLAATVLIPWSVLQLLVDLSTRRRRPRQH